MDPYVTIASLSIKAVNAYFSKKQAEQLQQIIDQNERLISFRIYQHTEQKRILLQQANRFLVDAQYSDCIDTRKTLLDKAFTIYSQLIAIPKFENMPDGTVFNNCEFISGGYYGRFCYFGIVKDYTNSTIQVYECAAMFPDSATKLFNSSFFPNIDYSQLTELCINLDNIEHYKPLTGIYNGIPDNMAKPLIELQMEKYQAYFQSMLSILKTLK